MATLRRCTVDGDCSGFKANGDAGKFSGYAATWSRDNHGERFMPGAFKASLAAWQKKGRLPSLYVDHPDKRGESRIPIGVLTKAVEDERGLYVEGEINLETVAGREVWALMKQGALRALSIGFRVAPDGARFNAATQTVEFTSVDVFEVSIVDQPANDGARIEKIKSRLAAGDTITVRDVEQVFKSIGFSRRESKKLCSCVKHDPAPNGSNDEREAADLEQFKANVSAAIAQWRDANKRTLRLVNI